jgi:hypothetical protein
MITGEELATTERAKEVGKSAALSIVEFAGAKIVTKAASAIRGVKYGEMSNEAKRIMVDAGIDENDAKNILKDVPLADQAKVLAQQSGSKGYGYMRKAIGEEDASRIKYLDEMNARKKAIDETIGVEDFDKIKKNTQNEYGAMKKYASTIVTDTDGYDLKGYSGRLRELGDLARTSTAKDDIERIAEQLDKYPLNSLEDLIDLRQVINHQAGKATTGKQRTQWKALKDDVDSYMKTTFKPDDMKIVDDSISSYSRMKSQEELIEIISSKDVTKVLGKGSKVGESGAVNWANLYTKVKESGLDSPEVRNTLKVSKAFMEKFGDMDAKLFGQSLPKGDYATMNIHSTTMDSAAKVLGIRKLMNFASKHFTADGRLQSAISKSIEKSDTQAEFILNVIKNENTPQAVKRRFGEIATKNHLNRASVNRSKFISRKSEEQAKKLQDSVQRTSVAIDKKDLSIGQVNTQIDKLNKRLAEKMTSRGRNTVLAKIQVQSKRRAILEKEKEMLGRTHADFSKRYNDSVQKVKELSMFTPKQRTGTEAVETIETYPKKLIKK